MLTARLRSPAPIGRGLSLVELLVGVAIGLFIVAAASLLVASQLTDNRRLTAELQVQQDLRASADIITRELRRAGSWGTLATSAGAVWTATSGTANTNPSAALTLAGACPSSTVGYNSARANSANLPYQFSLVGGAIKNLDGQELTDPRTMQVTEFCVTAQSEPAVRLSCSKLCADGTGSCWPTITVRRYVIDITGKSTVDPSVVRKLRTAVRVRNDEVATAATPGTITCPN